MNWICSRDIKFPFLDYITIYGYGMFIEESFCEISFLFKLLKEEIDYSWYGLMDFKKIIN